MANTSKQPWFFRSWFIIPQLIFFPFPWFGVALMWAGTRFPLIVRLGVTSVLSIGWIMILTTSIVSTQRGEEVKGPSRIVQTHKNETKVTAPLSREDQIRSIVKKLIDLPEGDARQIEVMQYSDGGYQVIIEFKANSYKSSILYNSLEMFSKIYQSPELSDINNLWLKPYSEMIDAYGQPSVDQVGKLIIDRPLAKKINWERMLPDQLKKILEMKNQDYDAPDDAGHGNIWLHPGLQ